MEIRALREDDDRTGFQSGDPDLDTFFQQYAGQNQFRHHVGITYIALDVGRVIGYATVAAGHLEIDDLSTPLRKHLPRYPSPVLRLGRLAVDRTAQGRGTGTALLRFAMKLALEMAGEYGCIGLLVDAKPGAVEYYEAFGFMRLAPAEGGIASRPAPVAMFLPIGEIRKGME